MSKKIEEATRNSDLVISDICALHTIWSDKVTIDSPFAIESADTLSFLACRKMITTNHGSGHGRVWRVTPKGLKEMWEHMEMEKEGCKGILLR